jgi:serine/threonine protein phosphatase PrpC
MQACDGVWDVISDEAACRIVASESDDILKASMKLRDYAYLFGSQDNISVIIVKFK